MGFACTADVTRCVTAHRGHWSRSLLPALPGRSFRHGLLAFYSTPTRSEPRQSLSHPHWSCLSDVRVSWFNACPGSIRRLGLGRRLVIGRDSTTSSRRRPVGVKPTTSKVAFCGPCFYAQVRPGSLLSKRARRYPCAWKPRNCALASRLHSWSKALRTQESPCTEARTGW